jgi:hypothetical protein
MQSSVASCLHPLTVYSLAGATILGTTMLWQCAAAPDQISASTMPASPSLKKAILPGGASAGGDGHCHATLQHDVVAQL